MRGLRFPFLLAICAALLLAGCGGDDSPSELNAADDQAVATGYKGVKDDLRDFADIAEAIELSGPDTGGVTEEVKDNMKGHARAILDAAQDEKADTTIPSQGGLTVKAFLSRLANEVSEHDRDLATEIDRVRDGLG